MLNQYDPQRHRPSTLRGRSVRTGTIPLGTIASLPDHGRVIVLAWLPREIGAARKENGRWRSSFVARGGHLAVVRRLSDGRSVSVSDHLLLGAE
jgi:hypothetical protein